MPKFYIVIFLFLSAIYPFFGQVNHTRADSSKGNIVNALHAFSSEPQLKGTNWGFTLIDCSNDYVVANWKGEQLLVPGSTQKLFVTGASLDLLPPTHKFITRCYLQTGIAKSSTEVGNIFIRSGGDPSWGSLRMNNLQKPYALAQALAFQLSLMGISKVSGSVIVIDDYYDDPFPPGSWTWEDMGNYYAPTVAGITWRDNRYSLTFKTGDPNSPSTLIRSDPSWLMKGHVNLVRAGLFGSGDEAFIHGMPLSEKRFVRGSLPPNRESYTIYGSLPDPGIAMAREFTDFLEKEDIEVEGESKAIYGHEFEGEFPLDEYQELISFLSPPLKDLLRYMNFRSDNLYAEMFLKELGKQAGEGATTHGGIEALLQNAQKLGLRTDKVQWKDGSGLSRQNLVTTHFQAQFLAKLTHEKSFTPFLETLPEAGKEGTLRYLKVGDDQGRIWAKSGTMSGVRAYAGYYQSAGGKWYAFSFIVNNFSADSSTMRQLMTPVFNSFSGLP